MKEKLMRNSLLLAALAMMAYLTRTLRLPLSGWTPTGTEDGVGPLTVRQYWVDVEQTRQPGPALVGDVFQRLPTVFSSVLAVFHPARRTETPTGPGDIFTILMFGLRRGRIRVAEVAPDHFLLQTLRQHPESGTTEFRLDPLPDRVSGFRISIVSRMRSSSWIDRAGYLTGVGILQRLTWETVLRRALRLSGGRKVSHGASTHEWP
ncbi:hypothetical protein Q0M94_22360 (plasmid) [Deinococcus radiomollis]|uniref:hypothetical protein n=1 Tax=Deinococcus radiomollis TaxID=468916 RepID=UPI003891D04C